MDTPTLMAIAAMAVVTWACRAGGLLVAGWLPRGGRMGRALACMPGCVMVALVTPEVAFGGGAGWVAGAATVAVMAATRSLPLAMVAGAACMAAMRWGGV